MGTFASTLVYDNFAIRVKKHKTKEKIITYLEYYKNSKQINSRRVTSNIEVQEIFNSIRKIKYPTINKEGKLIAECHNNGQLIIDDYIELKNHNLLEKLVKILDKMMGNNKKINNLKIMIINLKTLEFLNVKLRKSITTAILISSLANLITVSYNENNHEEEIMVVKQDYHPKVKIESIKDEYQKDVVEYVYLDNELKTLRELEILESEPVLPPKKEFSSLIPIEVAQSYKVAPDIYQQMATIIYLEAGGKRGNERYTDALAVGSVILNRIEDPIFVDAYGSDIKSQLEAPSQFEVFSSKKYEYYLNHPEKIPTEIFQALDDLLAGSRNTNFLEFRASYLKMKGRTQYVSKGNYYFNEINIDFPYKIIDEAITDTSETSYVKKIKKRY